MKELFEVRSYKPSDKNFIISSWLSSYYFQKDENNQFNSWATKGIRKSIFTLGHSKVINSILDRSKTLILCDKENEDSIIGWIVYEKNCLHYVFIQKDFRKNDLLSLLLPMELITSQNIWYSHITKLGNYALPKEDGRTPDHINYNPYFQQSIIDEFEYADKRKN